MRHERSFKAEERVSIQGDVVRLAGIGTAVPPYELEQSVVKAIAERTLGPRYPQFQRLAKTFTTAGVERRYSVCPTDWFEHPQSWPERTARYLEGATALFIKAARCALDDAGWAAGEVDAVITVSSTGIATPTLEARAFQEMGFRRDVQRVPVFGLGCAGGVSGLSIARRLAFAEPGTKVLFVCVETCTLSFRDDRMQKADIIATVLFGDGAGAVCLSADGPGHVSGPVLGEGAQYLWPDTLDIMGWDVDPTGFGVIFDRSIPVFVQDHFAEAVNHSLAKLGLKRAEVDRFICHPGGAKVLEAIEGTMGLLPSSLDYERQVLRDFGNMSAPTVLFVLDRAMRAGQQGQTVLAALGPGFTASFLPLDFDG